MIINNIKGGNVIASGGFGCVFKPSLKCKGKPRNDNEITKLLKTKYAKSEFKYIQQFKKILDDISNYNDYFLLDGFSLCKPDKFDDSDIDNFNKKCKPIKKLDITPSNINSPTSLNKLMLINMPYGGIDVGDYIEEHRMNYKKLYEMNISLIQILQNGILPMNERNIYHCDIKDSNILVKDEINKQVKTRLIDWGLSVLINPNDKNVPKELQNKSFQFNIPFSVILFNDIFDKMYTEFLKQNHEPSFFIIRSFVINYVIVWIKKRGLGHLKPINSMFKVFFENGIDNVDEQFKKELIQYDYTFYFIFEYISYVLFKFTHNGKFEKMKYFSTIFLKNIDVWGFTMTYLPILEYLYRYNNKLCDCELQIIEKIKEMILYIIECSYIPIDNNKIILKTKELNDLFLKAEKKSTITFKKISSSSSSSTTTSQTNSIKKSASKSKSNSKSKSKSKSKSSKKSTSKNSTRKNSN